MKIKGRYEVEFDRRDWWYIIILFILVVGLVAGNNTTTNFMDEIFKRWNGPR